MGTVRLISPLPLDECLTRLKETIDQGILNSGFGSAEVIGRVSNTRVRLRKRTSFRNSYTTFLTGAFKSQEGVTVFDGRFGIHPVVLIIHVGWVVACLYACYEVMMSGSGHPLEIIKPLFMLMLGIAVFLVGRFLARGEKKFLIGFMDRAIQAKET